MKLYRTQHEYDTQSFLAGATITVGLPLNFDSDGKLVASAAPLFIALSPAKNGEFVTVHEIRKDEEYSAKLSADGSSLDLGDAVKIATNGTATATTADGIFKITGFPQGTKTSGSIVVGRFI